MNLLLIGWDEHLCLSIAYSLRNEPFDIFLLTHNQRSSCKYSRYIQDVFYYKDYSEMYDTVTRISHKISLDLIMPYDELESLHISKSFEKFNSIAKVPTLTRPDLFEIAIDKNRLNDFLRRRNVDLMPKSVRFGYREFKSNLKKLSYPYLLKPSRSSYGRGIVAIKNEEDLENFYKKQDDSLRAYSAQQYIEGSDITCGVYCEQGKIIQYTIQESPVKSLDSYSRNEDLRFLDDPEVLKVAQRVMKELEWSGVACIDMRRDVHTGKIYLLEINGRFWGSILASLERGNVNFANILVRKTLQLPLNNPPKKYGKQISLSSFLRNLRKLKPATFKMTKLIPYISDPMPRLVKLLH